MRWHSSPESANRRGRRRRGAASRRIDPERYGHLSHPGDAFAYDIFTQVGRTLRSAGAVDPLDGLTVERIIAAGESQSAFALTTYVNGDPATARTSSTDS